MTLERNESFQHIGKSLLKADPSWDWERVRGHCLREARRYLFSRADAEEAVQEALLRAWSGRSKCRQPEKPLGWLLQITRNESLRVLARRKRQPTTSPLEEDQGQAACADAAIDEVLVRVDVRSALMELGQEDRRLVQLRYEEGLTQPRCAEILGLPEGTVKVRLHRIRRKLRERLQGAQ